MAAVTKKGRFDGTIRYASARWPTYLTLFGGGSILAFVLIGLGAEGERWWLVVLGLVLLLLLAYFLTTSLWAAHELYDQRQSLPSQVIFQWGSIQPTSQLVYVGLGVRDTPLQLSRRMTRGHVQAIDVYNPQLTPSTSLARRRRLATPAPPDPRLSWLEGNINLLPLPDNSVHLVASSHTLVEFWQEGDRRLLLREMRRILRPGGFIILAEPVRTKTQLVMFGPAAWRLPTEDYWRALLQETGFQLVTEMNVGGYYTCFRAEKPFPGSVQQLSLDLGL